MECQHNPRTGAMGSQKLEGGRPKEQRFKFILCLKLLLLLDQYWKAQQREESLHMQVTGI